MKQLTPEEATRIARKAVLEEVCTCGQPRAVHADNVYGEGVVARGHGPLRSSGCARFTWDGVSGPFAVK